MATTTRDDFTPEQHAAFGLIIADNIGANIQTGISRGDTFLDPFFDGLPYIAVQKGPNLPIVFHYVERNGRVEIR